MSFILLHATYVLRMIIACTCGVLIGYERKNRLKEAGVRTHCVVACGAALMMILSKYAYTDMQSWGELYRVDVSRIAAGVASGIGFLGAGMIFVHNQTVSGLTTAAGVWTTAGIGMAIGAGLYIEGMAATVIILAIQVFLHHKNRLVRTTVTKKLIIYSVKEDNYSEKIERLLAEYEVYVHDINVMRRHESSEMDYELKIEIPSSVKTEAIVKLFEYDSAISANR